MMKIKQEEKTELTDNIIPFVKPDGKGPKQDNWLINLPLGTVFFARPKNTTSFMINEFMRGSSLDEFVLMVEHTPLGQPQQYWVDSVKFSKYLELVKVREIPDEDSVP
jgi:hypothetical protein